MRVTLRYKPKTILTILLLVLITCYLLTLLPRTYYELELSTALYLRQLPRDTNEKEKYRLMRHIEFQYKEQLENLTPEEIKSLSDFYHRDITIHWGGKHGLLPASKPPPDIKCLDFLDKVYTVRVTVLITYKNDVLLLLYRALTTIVERTPSDLLHEILLIDDGSDKDDSLEILEYCRVFGIPVRMMRNDVSVGIANARYAGIRAATGDVIAILDSHMEVSEIWLQPLLDILKHKPAAVAIPLVHMMGEKDYDELRMNNVQPYGMQMAGGFENMQFYIAGPPEDNVTKPYLVSSLAGGALAAYKTTLIDLYPASIVSTSWGIENNRLALRVWLCGDGLWVPPCSQVLHTNGNDISLHRYTKDSNNLMNRLKGESLAEITNFIKDPPEQRFFLNTIYLDEASFGPVFNLAEIMKQTFEYSKCPRDYDWYLKNVHSSHHYKFYDTPGYVHVGEIQSEYLEKFCLSVVRSKLGTEPSCRKENVYFFDTHLLSFSKNGAIHVGVGAKYCLDAPDTNIDSEIIAYICHEQSLTDGQPYSTQRFAYNVSSKQITHISTNRCVTLEDEAEGGVRLRGCVLEDIRQRWFIHEPWWRRVTS